MPHRDTIGVTGNRNYKSELSYEDKFNEEQNQFKLAKLMFEQFVELDKQDFEDVMLTSYGEKVEVPIGGFRCN